MSPLSRVNLIPFTVLPISTAGCNVTAHPGMGCWGCARHVCMVVSIPRYGGGAADMTCHVTGKAYLL